MSIDRKKRSSRALKQNERPRTSAIESSSGVDDLSNDVTQYVTARQAASILGVVTDHVYRLIESDKVKSIRLGHEWLIYVPSIQKYLDTKSARGRPPSRKPPVNKTE